MVPLMTAILVHILLFFSTARSREPLIACVDIGFEISQPEVAQIFTTKEMTIWCLPISVHKFARLPLSHYICPNR